MKSLTFIIIIIILIAYMNDENTERINHNDHFKKTWTEIQYQNTVYSIRENIHGIQKVDMTEKP